MRAYILSEDSGDGKYSLATEDGEILYSRWCSNRSFANHDLTRGIQEMLESNGITEVYSSGVLVWSGGRISERADLDFRAANYEYERKNSNAL